MPPSASALGSSGTGARRRRTLFVEAPPNLAVVGGTDHRGRSAPRRGAAAWQRAAIEKARSSDGTWPSYWWRACHYSTYWNLRALRALGWQGRYHPVVDESETHGVHTVFD